MYYYFIKKYYLVQISALNTNEKTNSKYPYFAKFDKIEE